MYIDFLFCLFSQLSQCKLGGQELAKLLEEYKKEVNVLNVYVRVQRDNGSLYEKISRDMEQELIKVKVESGQGFYKYSLFQH